MPPGAYLNPAPGGPETKGYVAFYWDKMDAWYEEDEQVFAHARDPYKRVDILPSSRHVRVLMGGEVVADTRRPKLLLETGIITRYYIPAQDIRMDLLESTEPLPIVHIRARHRTGLPRSAIDS